MEELDEKGFEKCSYIFIEQRGEKFLKPFVKVV